MRTIITVLFALSLAACGNDPWGGTANGLIEVDPDTVPLEEVANDEWRGAPPSCDGLLSPDVDFLLASAEEELVAAVNENGEIVCVDTVSSVQDELSEQGASEQAAEL